MAEDMMELLEGDVLDVMDSDDDCLERYYDPDDELPEALRAKMAAKEAKEAEKAALDPEDALAATVKASLEESEAAAKNAVFDEDELAAAVKASIAASEAEAEKAAFDQGELEAAMRESMRMMETNRGAYSPTPSRLSPVAVEPPFVEQERPGSLTGGFGLPPGLPPVFLPPGLTPPPGLPSPPGLLPPPGLGAPPGLPPPPGIPFRVSRDSGIAGDRSPTDSEEKYGSEHGSNTQSESSADGNVDEVENGDEASTETCTVVDGTKDLDYATPFDDPSEQEWTTVKRSKGYRSATPFADARARPAHVWTKLETCEDGVYSRETMMIIKEEVGEATLNFENCTDVHEHCLHILYPDFEIPGTKLKPKGAAQRKWKDKRSWEQRSFYENNQTTGENLLMHLQSSFSDVKQKNYEKRVKKEEWSTAEVEQSGVDDGRKHHYTSIQFASERAEKEDEASDEGQWNEDGTREGSEKASQSGEERRGSVEDRSEGGENTSSSSRRGSGSSGNEEDVAESRVTDPSTEYNDAEPPRSAFASVARNEEVRDRSDTFESRGTEGTGVYGSADDRSFDARSPPEGSYLSRDRASTQSSFRNDSDVMKERDDREWDPREEERQKEEPVLESHHNTIDFESGQGWGHESEQRHHSRRTDDSFNSRNRNDSDRQIHESYASQHSRSERGERDSRDNWNNTLESNGRRDRHDEERQWHESYASHNSRSERGSGHSHNNWGDSESNRRRDWHDDDRQMKESHASQHERSHWHDRDSRGRSRHDEQKSKKEVVYERYNTPIGSSQGWGPGGGWPDYWNSGTGDRDSHNNWNARQYRDKNDWKHSTNTANSWEERHSRDEDHQQYRSSKNAHDNYQVSQHSDGGRRDSRDRGGSQNSHDDRYHEDYNHAQARTSERSHYGSQADTHDSRDNEQRPDAFGNQLDAYPDAEQLELHNNRRSPHSRNRDDRERQPQFTFNSIQMDADRAARFLKINGNSTDFHGPSRTSQASRGSGNAIFDQRDSRDHHEDEYPRGSRDVNESSRMSQSSYGHHDERHHRDNDSSRQFGGSRDRVDDRVASSSYAGSNADYRDRASNNNSREWNDDRSRERQDRRDDDRRSEASRYSERDRLDTRDSREDYNTRLSDRHSQGSRSYAGSNVDHRDHRDTRESRDWHDTRDFARHSQHSRTSHREARDQRDSRDHHHDSIDFRREHDARSQASRSYAGSNYDHRDSREGRDTRRSVHASREAINDRAHERPRQPSRVSDRPDADLGRRELRASGSSRCSRADPLEQYNERKARDEREEMERREKEWKLRVVYEEQVLRARMRTKDNEPLCGYLAKEYGIEKPALKFCTRQPSESTKWVRGRTDFMAHVYYPDRDTAEAVEDEVIQRWYKEGLMHPSVLFSMKYGDWKAFHSQEAWLGEKEWVETPFHGQLDVRRRENEIEMDEFRFGEWTDEVLHIMQQHDKKMKAKQ